MFCGEPENIFCAVHIGEDGAHRIVHHQFHTDRRRQMDDCVALRHQRAEQFGIGHHVRFDHLQPGIVDDGGEIVTAAGGKIVHHSHGSARCQQRFRKMTADETGATGNQIVHDEFPF